MFAFVHLYNDNSGSPIVLRESIRCLTRRSEDGLLFVGKHGRGVLDHSAVPIRHYHYKRSSSRFLTLISFIFSQLHLFYRLTVERLPPDAVIYINTLLPFGAAIWGRLHSRTVIYHIHEVSVSPRALQSFLAFIARKCADLVIYVSADNQRRLPLKGVRSLTVYNSIPRRTYEKAIGHKYTPRVTGKFNILMLASLRDYKGIPEFIDLANRLSDRSDTHFTLVINDSDDAISKYFCEVTLPSNVTVHGKTFDPAQFFKKADLLLNLSRVDQWVETFGLTIVEAMAFGVPVIAPPLGGPSEIVTDSVEGFLVDSRCGVQLERHIRALLDDPNWALALSSAGRSRAEEFAPEKFAKNLREAVRPLL